MKAIERFRRIYVDWNGGWALLPLPEFFPVLVQPFIPITPKTRLGFMNCCHWANRSMSISRINDWPYRKVEYGKRKGCFSYERV